MRPTRFGLKALAFHATMVVAFYAMPYSNAFFLLLGFLTLLGVAGVAGAIRNLRGIDVALAEPEPIPSGTAARVPVEIRVPRRGGRFDVRVRVELGSGEILTAHADRLTSLSSLELESGALTRGVRPIEGVFLETGHPFGLVVARRRVAVANGAELVVYPNPSEAVEGRSHANPLEDLALDGDDEHGDLQPSSLRDHREGEGLRGVHWRASARRGRLVVSEWEGGRGQGLEVVLDRRASNDEFERALATISAIVEFARAAKEPLRLHSQGLSATYGEGGAPWSEALRFLAVADALPANGPAPPATSPNVLRLPGTERERRARRAA